MISPLSMIMYQPVHLLLKCLLSLPLDQRVKLLATFSPKIHKDGSKSFICLGPNGAYKKKKSNICWHEQYLLMMGT